MENVQAGRSGSTGTTGNIGKPVDGGRTRTPLERSWIVVSLLLVWLAVYAAEFTAQSSGPGERLVPALIYAVTAALIGLAVFGPARPPALRLRVGIYLVPVLLETAKLAFIETEKLGMMVDLAFLPPLALVAALYGVRGGLPKGVGYAVAYAVTGLLSLSAGYGVSVLILGWVFPLLPLVLLLLPRYRRPLRRAATEVALSLLVVVCSTAWFTGAAGVAYFISFFSTAVFVGLGYAARHDTAEYQTRAERLAAAHPAERDPEPGLPQSDTGR